MRIAVASGKGGTGKTTVAVNLALTAARSGLAVHLCDCDVEEPNARLFLDVAFGAPRDVTVPVPVVEAAICSHCPICNHARRRPDSWIGRVLHHPLHADHCPFWKAERVATSERDEKTG